MKKNLIGVGVLAGVIAGVTGITGAMWYLSKPLTKEKVKELVHHVWKMEQDRIIEELDLRTIPTLEIVDRFEEKEKGIMYVETTYVTRTKDFSFQKKVINTYTNGIIHVSTEAIAKCINSTLTGHYRKRKELSYSIVKFLLAHECRHIWQAEKGYHNGEIYNSFNILEGIDGHGCKPEEYDANTFAETLANNQMENKLFTLLRLKQELCTKIFMSTEDCNIVRAAESELCACL